MSILERLRRQSEGLPLLEAVEQLSARDLTSLLLHVFGRQAASGNPCDLLARFERLEAARPLKVDARALHRAEGQAFEAAREFEALALPPTLPLGSAHLLGGTHQNNVLSALRGLEVMADPTTWLALEAARRRKTSSALVRLCCSQRVIRTQPLSVPGLLPHFHLFALATVGRRQELAWLREHAAVWLELLERLKVAPIILEVSEPRLVRLILEDSGLPLEDVRACVRAHDLAASRQLLRRRGLELPRGRGWELEVPESVRPRLQALEEEVLQPLARLFPHVQLAIDLGRLEGLGYYCGPTLRISADQGARLPCIDGGLVDWPSRLLSRRREAMFASGVGLDLLARLSDLT